MGSRNPQPKSLAESRRGLYVVRPEVSHREVAGQVVILTSGESGLFTLNASAALIWPQLVRGCDAARLAASLARAYGIDALEADRDVEALIGELLRRKIIVRQRR